MTHENDSTDSKFKSTELQACDAAASESEERLEHIMEGIRQAEDPIDAMQRAVDQNPALASRIIDEVALEKSLRGSAPLLIPERIGRYVIHGEIAHGGMGSIYRASDPELRRFVAIKTIRQDRDAFDHERRFLHERHVLAHLHETRIIPILDAGTFEHGGRTLLYYVMPLMEGAVALGDVLRWAKNVMQERETPRLSDLVVKAHSRAEPAPLGNAHDGSGGNQAPAPAGRGPTIRMKPVRHSRPYLESVARVMANVADALNFAHSRGIIHRDCKPDNILITPGEEVFLLDFGLAIAAVPGGGQIPENAPVVRENAGAEMFTQGKSGTPEYMAPEHFAGRPSVQTEVWSLGATLYEHLTFDRPFGKDRNNLEEQVRTLRPRRMQDFADKIPKDLEAICLKAMQKEPAQRYRSAAEFGNDLRKWLNGFPTVARPAGVPRRVALWSRRNPGWATTIGVAIVALVVFGRTQIASANAERAAALQRSRESERESSLQMLQRIRLTAHREGWSRESLRLAKQAADTERDDHLRDEAIACLTGLDAKMFKLWEVGALSVTFSADGRNLLMGGLSKGPQLWNAATDRLDEPLPAGAGPTAFAASGDGLLWTSETPWSFALWNVTERKMLQRMEAPLPDGAAKPTDAELVDVRSRVTTAISRDGSLVSASVPIPDEQATWTGDSGVTLVWNANGDVLRRVERESSSLCFSPDNALLAVGYDDGAVDVMSLRDGKIVATLHQSRNRIHSLDFTIDPLCDGDSTRWLLAAGDAGGTVTIWDLTARQPRAHCRGSHYDVFTVKFSPDGMTLASAGRLTVRLWDYLTGQQLLEIRSGGDYFTGLSFSPDGRRLAVSCPNRVTLWSLESGRGIAVLRGMSSQAVKTCLSADGRMVVAQGQNWEIGVFDTNPCRLRYILPGPRGFTADNSALALSPDNKFLATSSGTEARIFNIENGALIKRHPLPPGLVDQLAFTPDGKLLSVRVECQDGETPPMSDARPDRFPRVLRIRDLLGDEPGKPLQEITRFNWHVFCAMVHPDGRFFVADGLHRGPDGDAQEIIAFDGITGKELWRHERSQMHRSPFLVLDPTGNTLAYSADLGDGSDQVRFPSGKPCGKNSGLAFALANGGTHYLTHGEKLFDGEHAGFALHHHGQPRPIATLGIDFLPHDTSPQFSRDGRWLVFGTTEGVVVVCDLHEVSRKLVELGFPRLD